MLIVNVILNENPQRTKTTCSVWYVMNACIMKHTAIGAAMRAVTAYVAAAVVRTFYAQHRLVGIVNIKYI